MFHTSVRCWIRLGIYSYVFGCDLYSNVFGPLGMLPTVNPSKTPRGRGL